MHKDIGKHLHYAFFTALFLIQVFFLLFNSSTYGGADNVAHFQIARYAYKYPALFLDHWGKPVYTTLLAPFALLGYSIAKVFNLVVAFFSLLVLAGVAKRMSKGNSLHVMILAAFSPVYFLLMTTCLTEMLFSLVLIASVFLFSKKQFIFSALVLSFIPFVRTEGYILLPVFAFAFLLKRAYWPILLLTIGTVFYSCVGFFVFGDLLWLIHKMPYSMGDSLYGSGSLFHFVKNSNFIFGVPFLFLLGIGLLYWLFEVIKKRAFRDDNFILFVIIAGSWSLYFLAHSYVWWKGTGGSLGLIRVMGGIIPLAALTCLKGIDFLKKNIKSQRIANSIVIFVSLLQVVLLFTQTKLPLKADTTDLLITKAADYLRFSEANRKLYYFNPLVVQQLDVDPYDTNKCNWGIADKIQPSNSMNWGDLIVWDAHFGPNEGGVSLDALENDPFLEKIKSFYPVEKITVLGGFDYSVQVFKKVANKENSSTPLSNEIERVLTFDAYSANEVKLVDGIKVWEMDEKQEYSPSIKLTAMDFIRYETLEFNISLAFKALNNINPDEVLLVFSLENDNEHLRYDKEELVSSGPGWEDVKMHLKIPGNIPETSSIAVYIWNKDKKHFLVKELKVNISSY